MATAQDIINRACFRGHLKRRFKGPVVEGRVPLKGYERLIIPEAPRWRGAVLKRRDFLVAAGLLPFALRTGRARAIPPRRLGLGFGGGFNGFLPSGHWQASPLPYAQIYPQSSGVSTWARHLTAYYDGTNAVPMIIPLCMQGLALPIVWSIVEAPAGTALGMIYVSSANASGPNYAGYGDLIWYPQSSFSSGSPADFEVQGTGQDGTSQQASWSTATSSSTSSFIFADAHLGSDSGSGSISSPFQTLQHIYGLTQNAVTSYVGAQLYLRGNSSSVNYEAYDQTGVGGIEVNGNKNPITIMGFPGDPTPNIDITPLEYNGGDSDANHVFGQGGTGSDMFFQGFSFSGTPTGTSNGFNYFVDNQANNSRLTYHNITSLSTWQGADPTSTTSGLVCLLETAPSGQTQRQNVFFKGLTVSGITASEGVAGGFLTYNVTNAVAEFCSITESSGVGLLWKVANTYVTRRYNFSQGTLFPFEQDGFLISGAPTNAFIEDCFNYAIGSNTSSPAIGYELSDTNGTTDVYGYRNTVYNGAIGVGQDASLSSGPYTFSNNAIQWGTEWTQGVIGNIAGAGWTGGTWSNVTNTGTSAQAASGVLDGTTYALTGSYASLFGQYGAGIG
jgi:hypothetical protein